MSILRRAVASFIVVSALTVHMFGGGAFELFAFEETSEVTGELVHHACYLKDKLKNVGSGHQDCATLCALKGETLAVVTEKGELYEIAGDVTKDNNSALIAHMSHRVVLTGEIVDKDGKRTIVATGVRMANKR